MYVGNLAWEVGEDELRKAFEEHGKVSSVSVIKDKFSGRSRGFGFVEMENDEEAKVAISALNEKELGGRNIKVNEAKPRKDRGDSRGDRGGRGGREGGQRW